MAENSYTFLPWVKSGIGNAITSIDNPTSSLKSRVKLPVTVKLGPESTAISKVAKVDIQILGPGEVTGIDQRQIVRTVPSHQGKDFEQNSFPMVEFDRPDFPWLFTPTKANNSNQLRPWICLVVVPKKEGIINADPSRPLPILQIDDAQTDLPDLSECWAWAHAQISGPLVGGDTIDTVLSGKPERVVSRLICPRLLKANSDYYACIVPTFAVGCKAGLGQEITDEDHDKLETSWNDSTGSIELPIYYHWEFSTGQEGDFESLVWRLEQRKLPSNVGKRDISVKDPGAGLPKIGVLSLEGALKIGDSHYKDLPAGFEIKLRNLLNNFPSATTSPSEDIILPPPIYGRWHAAKDSISSEESTPKWLRELNMNPVFRVAAGFGTLVVQENQEALMASAWQQVGEIERINQLLRQGQFARAGSMSIYHHHFIKMSNETLITITSPVNPQIMLDGKTIRSAISNSTIPINSISSQFRRITRRRGHLARKMQTRNRRWTDELLTLLNNSNFKPVPGDIPPKGMVTVDSVYEHIALDDSSIQFEKMCTITPEKISEIIGTMTLPENKHEIMFGTAAITQQRYAESCEPKTPIVHPALDIDNVRSCLISELDPNLTVTKRILKRLTLPDNWNPVDPLEPVMAAPEFPTPMYSPLAEISKDMLLPGLENIPNNTISILRTNPTFIEAYMVGLNHEMSRELLWRGYPTDQRGTYFRQFWDPAGHVPKPITAEEHEMLKDIKPIHEWESKKGLGENMNTTSSSAQMALVIKGDLLRRYPNAIIYVTKGKWDTKKDNIGDEVIGADGEPVWIREPKVPADPGFAEKYPIYRGTLPPDTTFLGFEVDLNEAIGDNSRTEDKPGWFIVIQQPHSEPHFGLDMDPATTSSSTWTWKDLSWSHIKKNAAGYIQLSGRLDPVFTPHATSEDPANIAWDENANSALLSYITLQEPVRIAIHASDLITLGDEN